MPEIWLPSAERVQGAQNAGAFTGDPWRGLLHTTEGSRLSGALNTFRGSHNWPHFIVDPIQKRFVQCLALDVAGRALRDGNRNNCIQIELVGQASGTPDWSQGTLYFLALIMRQIEALVPIPRVSTLDFIAYPQPRPRRNVRLSNAEWRVYTGWCGHQHAPSRNTHGDPGAINIAFLLDPINHILPQDILEGHLSALAIDATRLHLFTIRSGRLNHDAWSAPNIDVAELDIQAINGTTRLFPWAQPQAIRQTLNGALHTWVVSVGRPETDNVAGRPWQLIAFRQEEKSWKLDTQLPILTPSVDPEIGCAAVSRAPEMIEICFAGPADQNGDVTLYNTTLTGQQSWTQRAQIAAPDSSFAPLRSHGMVTVSHTPGQVDLFVVNRRDSGLYQLSSSRAGQWQGPVRVGGSQLVASSHGQLATVSRELNTIDVFVVGKASTDADWRLYNVWWRSQDGWGSEAAPHTQFIGGAAVPPQPMAGVGAISRGPDVVDVFIVGRNDRRLYTAGWERQRNFWTQFHQIGGDRIEVLSIDAVVSRTPESIDVIVTDLHTNVSITTITTTSGAATPFVALPSIQVNDVRHPVRRLRERLQQQRPQLRQQTEAASDVTPQSSELIRGLQLLMKRIASDYPSPETATDVDAINADLDQYTV